MLHFGLRSSTAQITEINMNNLIYLVGLIVIIIAIASFFGLR